MRAPRAPTFGAAPAYPLPSEDRDASMREIARREAVEILAHQLEVERGERARVQVQELLVTVMVLGGAFGASFALTRYVNPGRVVRGIVGGKKKDRRHG